MVMGVVALFVVVVGGVHVGEHGEPIDGLVERLRGARSVGVLGGILLVEFGFFFGAFLLALPVAAELVVDEFVGGEVRLAGVRIVLDDLLQPVFIHLLAHVGVLFLCGGRLAASAF